jgi:hypothetical protein
MKKTQLTFLQKVTVKIMIVTTMMLMFSVSSFSQCSLGCNSNVQVSLDNASCTAVVTPAMMLGTIPPTSCPAGVFTVEVRVNGILVPNATVTKDHIGKVLEVKVKDSVSGNSCWGNITVEDKLAPVIVCTPPTDIFCYQLDTYKPVVIENCSDYTLAITAESVVTNNCTSGIPANILKVVTRTYIATDKSGNKSAPCTVTFNITAIPDLAAITQPINYLFPTNNLQCDGNFALDANGNPSPSVTGAPTLNGLSLFPTQFVACNIISNYKDTRLPAVGCVTKIMREWTIIEWSCANPQRTRTFLQMIEIADSKGPVMTGLKDLTISTSAHKCEALFNAPAVTVKDNCSSLSQIKVTISGGTPFINANGGQTSLPIGEHKLYYRATDACGNLTVDSIRVWVDDLTPPVAVCDQATTVALTSDGTALVNASSFDDGSYDECKLAKMLVRRMDNTNCNPCPTPEFPGFHYLGTREGKYYYLSAHPLVPRLAFKHSKAIAGYAVSLETAAEQDWLYEQVQGSHPGEEYIVGLKYDAAALKYTWESGKPYTGPDLLNSLLINDPNYYFISDEDGDFDVIGGDDSYKYVVEIDDPCGFSSYVKFCCADVPNNVMVQFRVIDAACNYNECMVNATIQDKIGPSITCPADRTVNCDFAYDVNNLKATFGEATVVDNCATPTITETNTPDINQCQIGSLVRTITATDAGGRKASCTQKITFEAIKPFYINKENPLDPNDDIVWPVDVTTTGCEDPGNAAYDPSVTGKPQFLNGACTLVGADYDDQIFTFNNSTGTACFKILRTWTVIDWCQFKNGQYFTCSYTQVIKVNNTVDPVIVTSCARKEVCTYDNLCKDGYIELTSNATDDCTRGLKWIAKIDLNNDGSFESGLSKSGTGTSATTAAPTVANASGTYPTGSHRVQWSFEDKCGNIKTCDQLFDIVNCKAPTPYLLNGLSVDLMPQDFNNDGKIDGGMVELWAKDFDNGSSHPCGYKVLLSFSPNVKDANKTFTCADKGKNNVRIYASIITPQGDTIRSFANTFVDIQDNMKACPTTTTGGKVIVQGTVMTEAKDGLHNATMILESAEQMLEATNEEGRYVFAEMPIGGSYKLSGVKNDDNMNGISTLDLVLIQRHILGIEKLKSPYLYIAADVNNDLKITASDLVELRKLILGVNSKFTNNTSWRFVDKGFTFPDPSNPLGNSINESYDIVNLSADMDINFVAVKTGDVNGSVKANVNNVTTEPRSNSTLNLSTEVKSFSKGDLVNITLTADQKIALSGLQFTLAFDSEMVELKDLVGVDFDINDNNLGLSKINEGLIAFSWNKDNAVDLNQLMTLTFIAKKDGSTESLLAVNSDITKAEGYDSELEFVNVVLRNTKSTVGFDLFQNTPNPFSATTSISFTIPQASNVNFKVYDVTGKVLKLINKDFTAGTHTINLDKTQLGQSGVLYYQLEAGQYVATKKMVVIE